MAEIFCFSATGNSLYTAKRIAEALEGKSPSLTGSVQKCKITSMTSQVKECSDDMIGFVFPTFFLGLPPIVEKFIEELNITNPNAYIFTVTTCGDFTFNLDGAVQQLLKKKGCKLSYFARVRMVENYTPIYPVNNFPVVHRMAERKIRKIQRELLRRKKEFIKPYGIINRVMHWRYPIYRSVPCDSRFTVTDCSSCGMCERVCPNHNIKIVNGIPSFEGNCQLCLACLHICPKEAINYNQATKRHKRYTNPYITKKELIEFTNK